MKYSKTVLSVAIVQLLAFMIMAGVGRAEQDRLGPEKVDQPLRLELNLCDGSRIIGVPGIETVPVRTAYAKMDIPLKMIMLIKMNEDHETASIDLMNSDNLKGVISLEPIKLETIFGNVAIALGTVRELRVMAGGAALPAGDGPLSFGGVNWKPWRTLFEVQGDKLVSLPKVRPGFNYGHSGNGRGPALITNIGNTDWKDYSIELDFCMKSVDPSFNPHGLPQDYRGGAIMFHVVDAKESWNEPGSSMYSLSFSGDGGWSLTCSYNQHCSAQSGYVTPTSSGSRTLAEGKGLKHDANAGNKIRIDVAGTRIQIWVDGQLITDVRDEKMREAIGGKALDHGGFGVVWGHDTMGWIRNFSAKRL